MRVKIQSKTGTKELNINRRKAIKEKCLNCTAWFYPEITNCKFTECALYHFRTGVGKQNPKNRASAIRNYCLWCVDNTSYEVTKCTAKDCPLFVYRNSGVDRSVEIPILAEKTAHRAPSMD